MKKETTANGTALGSVFYRFFGHHYAVSKEVTHHIKEYKCIHCGKQVATDVGGKLSRLTPEQKEINKALEHIYKKRHGEAQTA